MVWPQTGGNLKIELEKRAETRQPVRASFSGLVAALRTLGGVGEKYKLTTDYRSRKDSFKMTVDEGEKDRLNGTVADADGDGAVQTLQSPGK